ncbi:hypothetical protein AB0J47_41800 [Nocardia sp. NPDC049737]|uniref:hypothetical protein n=1 Tax=Nocardia sp. NPDC049737 TaxID=3154358 RepID=UPI003430CC36
MSTPTLIPASEDYGENGIGHEPVPFVLVSGSAFGIQLPNGELFREPEARKADPFSRQATVWFAEDVAEGVRMAIAITLEELYGIDPEGPSALRVVRLEMDADGMWRLPEVVSAAVRGYRPIDPDTGRPAALPCASTTELSTEQARQVMREHKECAGQLTCKIRGRARARLVRAGVMQLTRNPHVWQSLDLPDTAW